MKDTQVTIAKTLGVTQPTISHWLSGKVSPSTATLEKVKEVYPDLYEKISNVDYTKFRGITQEYLLSVFQYHNNGTLTWKVRSKGANIGDTVGVLNQSDYLYVALGRQQLAVHKIVWLMHHGYLPENIIDHINRVKIDNRIENLRETTRSCNSINAERENNSGVTGVSWDKRNKLWAVNLIGHLPKRYLSFDEAVKARFDAEVASGQVDCISSSAYKHLNWLKNRAMDTNKSYSIEELKIFNYERN